VLPNRLEKSVELAFKVDTFTVDAVIVFPINPVMVIPPVMNILDSVIVLPNMLEKRVELAFNVDTLIVDVVIVLPSIVENCVLVAFKVDTLTVDTST